MTPRSVVAQTVRDCIAKGIKAIIILGQGFADTGDEEGQTLQEEIVGIAQRGGARIVGPNTLGVGNAFNDFTSSTVDLKMERIPIGVIAQSGVFLLGIPTFKFKLVGKGIDLGNTCDVSFVDWLEYFEDDPDVKVIALYIENIRDGRRFIPVANRVAKKKPIIAIKGGRSEEGVKASQSHTGSLAGRDEIYNAALRQCGIIRAEDIDELEDLCKSFLRLPPMKGKKVGAITNSGAAGIMAIDACGRYGMELARFSPQTTEVIQRQIPSWMSVKNPVDVWAASSFMGRDNRETLRIVLEALMLDKNVDGVLITRSSFPQEFDVSGIVGDIVSRYGDKPIVSWVYGDYDSHPGDVVDKLEKRGQISAFNTAERAIRALAGLAHYSEFLREGTVG
jgi:acetyltransferase